MTTFVYVSLSGDDLIRSYEMHSDGRLKQLQVTTAAGGPSALACAPDGQTLYCSLRTTKELAAYRFESDGGLRLLGKRQLNADSCYVASDGKGRFLLNAYYGAGKVTVHRVEPDGSVGPQVCSEKTADRAHCIETDDLNRFALVPHPLEANSIFLFQFNEETGQLTPNQPANRLEAAEGLGPRHFVFSLDQRYVYTSNEDASSVTAYIFERPHGSQDQSSRIGCALRPIQTLSSLPEGFSGANTCAQIHLHPTGHTLYVSNRGHDSIAVYSVDTESGLLALKGWQSTEAVPRVFNVDPTGRFLLTAGQGSGNVVTYSICPDSGMLSSLNSYEVGNRPMWVLFRQV